MGGQRVFLLSVTLTAMAATPALGQDAALVIQSTASTPDFFGVWNHPSFPWYEPPASGPGPVTNRSRWPYLVNQQHSTVGGSPGLEAIPAGANMANERAFGPGVPRVQIEGTGNRQNGASG